jgi:PAS domain S-box-containing protein
MPLSFLRLQSGGTAVTRAMRLLGGLAASIFAISIPFLYFGLSVYSLQEFLWVESAGLAKTVEQIIQTRPDMWEFEHVRLLEIISQPSLDRDLDERILRTAAGTVVAKTDFSATNPALAVSAAFFDSGNPVGSIEVRHSIRKQLFVTVLLGILSSSLGYLFFFIFRTYPVRRLESVLTDLHRAEEEQRISRKTAEQLTEEMSVIAEIGRLIGSTLDIDEVYERVAAEARKLIPFDRVIVNLINPDGKSFTSAYVSGFDVPDRRPGATVPLAGSVSEIFINRQSGLIIHVESPEDLVRQFPRVTTMSPVVRAGIRSLIGVPLIYRNEVIGSLNFRSIKQNAYTEKELRLADKIGAQITGAIGAARLFSDLRKTENSLRESEEQYRTLVDNASDIVFTTDNTGHFTFVNPAGIRIVGYEMEEVIGRHYPTLIRQDMREEAMKFFGRQFVKGIQNTYSEYPVITKEGGGIWLGQNTKLLVRNGNVEGFQAIARDITVLKRAEEKIKASLLEKETMLKEIHHRVKNNLQVISSLLNMQSTYLEDGKARQALQESIARVRTMAMIHTQLYQSQDLTKVDFGFFIRDLIGNISQSYGRAESHVKINVDTDKTRLGIDASIPCGLILNELVSNALKHAFPNEKEGKIDITMRSKDDRVELTVQDNGIGFPKSVDFTKVKSLGLQLVNALVGQMNGKIDIQVDGGTTWTIAFTVKNEREWRNG